MELGRKFNSFKELDVFTKEIEEKELISLYRRYSKTLQSRSKACPIKVRNANPELKYYMLTYSCYKGGIKFKAKGAGKRKTRGGAQVHNPHLQKLKEDYLYHLALGTSMGLEEMFGDVKFVCTGGTGSRMLKFAEYIAEEIKLKQPTGSTLKNMSATADRYHLFKVGPVLSVSHGMGCPSMGILTHELIKLMYYAKCKDPIFFRLGTCGGIGHEGGTLIISEDCCDGNLKKAHSIPVLGKPQERPADLDRGLVEELKGLADKNDNFKTVSGTTMCTDDFYEGQGRLDGAFCNYSEEDKMQFLKKLSCQGIVNMEMESTVFAALTKHAGVRAAVVCVALLNRLNGDQITTPKSTMEEWQKRPQIIVARYIKKSLGIRDNNSSSCQC